MARMKMGRDAGWSQNIHDSFARAGGTPNTVLVPHGDTEVNDHSGDLGDEWHVFSISKIYITCKIAKHGDRGKV